MWVKRGLIGEKSEWGPPKSKIWNSKNLHRTAWQGSCPVTRAAVSGLCKYTPCIVELTRVVSAGTSNHVSLLENSWSLVVLPDTSRVRWHGNPCQDPVFSQNFHFFSSISPCSSSKLPSNGWAQTSPSVLCDLFCEPTNKKFWTTPKKLKLLELNSVGCLLRSATFNVAWLDDRLSYPLRRTFSINPLSCPL